LYPAGHPAIAATLGRIVQLTSTDALPSPMRITVLARELRVDGRSPAHPDGSVGELATMLHDRLIGELTVNAGGSVDAWRTFLRQLRDATSSCVKSTTRRSCASAAEVIQLPGNTSSPRVSGETLRSTSTTRRRSGCSRLPATKRSSGVCSPSSNPGPQKANPAVRRRPP
jgi:hypothetical protein